MTQIDDLTRGPGRPPGSRTFTRSVDPDVETIREFCEREGISPTTYRQRRREGFAPLEIHYGPRTIRIPVTEHETYRRKMAEYQQTDAYRLKRERMLAQLRRGGAKGNVNRKQRRER